MGFYLNSTTAATLYKSESLKPYFVDKSSMLEELFPLVDEGSHYLCITRPRRFGKTVMANMIASFFSAACDTKEIFGQLQIAESEGCLRHINRYPVIHLNLSETPRRCGSYEQYIERIERHLNTDLAQAYPEAGIDLDSSVWDALMQVFIADPGIRFVFVFDEWDFIFHQDFVTEAEKRDYMHFLRNLLKDRPYVLLAYMTGILPIAKYSSGSELNMFLEYTMVNEEKFSGYFGLTDREVDVIFQRYQKNTGEQKVTREGLQSWYDGYCTPTGLRVYNPRSVVAALSNNHLGNYWTSSGPYDEIFYYIRQNTAEIRDDLALLAAGEGIPAKIREYAATSMELQTKEEIYSAMVVYGFLSFENGKIFIPNRELLDRFAEMMEKETSLGYVHRLAKESGRMLEATFAKDTDTMAEILAYVHDTEVPLYHYNHETELTAIVNLVYLAARDRYRVEREDKAGRGFVDFIFYPEADRRDTAMILELKVGHSAEDAIEQIKQKKYALRFQGKLGEKERYTGGILAVGISYDKEKKIHSCAIEKLK